MPSNPKKPLTLKEALSSVADFRIDRRKKYPLYEILMITVCAMIDGARGPTDFWRFGRGKISFLRKFLPLVNGIPSHDTFRRVLGKLDTKRFNAAVVRWIQSVADISGDFVSIDGKLLRRALTKDGKMPCIVSAYSNNRKLVIGQIKDFLGVTFAPGTNAIEAPEKIVAIVESISTLNPLALVPLTPPDVKRKSSGRSSDKMAGTSFPSKATKRRCMMRSRCLCRTRRSKENSKRREPWIKVTAG